MQRFKRKGSSNAIVEAVKVSSESVNEIAKWARAQVVEELDALTGDATEGLNVKTPDGKRRASRGMYVIKHGSRFYVAGGNRFESMYEAI